MNKKVKNIVITGGGQNFGLKLIKNLLTFSNFRVIVLTRDSSKLKKKLGGYKNIFSYRPTDHQSNKKLLNKIEKKFGQVDVLINNATLNTEKGFKNFIENSDDKKVLNFYLTNSVSPLLMIKYTLSGSTQKKLVINILAGRALTGHSRHVEYYSSKAALYNATITLSNDYKKHEFINVMMGKIDLNDKQHFEKIVRYFKKIIDNHKIALVENRSNYQEIYFFFTKIGYIKHRISFFINNFLNSKRL